MSVRSEIYEQPKTLQKLLKSQWKAINEIANEIKKRQIDYIYLVARGSSDNAGLYAKYLFGLHNDLPIALAAPSMVTIYKSPPKIRNSIVLGISQSGQSPDIVSVVEEGRRQGVLTLSLVNVVDSPLAQAADYVIDLCAGEEKSIAATKSYSSQLMAIAMLSVALSGEQSHLKDLYNAIDMIDQILNHQEDEISTAAKKLSAIDRCVVLGRGFNYATAFEWALKLKELSYILASPYSTADFLHGPRAIVDEGFPVFMIAPKGETYNSNLDLVKKLHKNFNAHTLIISNCEEILENATIGLKINGNISEWVSPIVAIPMIQLFCNHLTIAKGYDVERPRGLLKVTKTR